MRTLNRRGKSRGTHNGNGKNGNGHANGNGHGLPKFAAKRPGTCSDPIGHINRFAEQRRAAAAAPPAGMEGDVETIRVKTPAGTAIAIVVGKLAGEKRLAWRAGYHVDLPKLDHRSHHDAPKADRDPFSTREMAVRVTAQHVRSILEGYHGDYKPGTGKRKLLDLTIDRVVKFIHHNPAADTSGRLTKDTGAIPGYRAPSWGQWFATLRGIGGGIQFGHHFAADLDKRADAELDGMGRFFVAQFKAGKRPADARDAWLASPLSAHFAPANGALLEFHPYSELLPPLSQADYAALEADIKRAGKILFPGMKLEGKILDGRHRYAIGKKLGIPMEFETFDPAVHGDPAAWVLSKATGRQLANEQRPFVAVRFLGVFEAAARERQRKAGGHSTDSASRKSAPDTKGKASEKAGEFWGCSSRSIEQAKLIEKVAPDLFDLGFAGRTRGADGKVRPGINVSRALAEYKRREKIKQLDAGAAAARKHFHAIDAKRPYEIVEADALVELEGIDVRPRLIFTDPRYNLGLDYGQGAKADQTPEKDYLDWCGKWIRLCADALSEDGSMFVMIDLKHQAEIWLRMKAAGLHFRTSILWYEKFGNYNPATFTPRCRMIHYFAKNENRHVWNADTILIPSARELVYNDARRVDSGMVPPNVWDDIPRLNDNDPERMPGFPTQIPKALARRIVLAASDPGDVVLDPFNGTGTTGDAAITEGRLYVGIDIVKRNVEFSQKRLDVAFHKLNPNKKGASK
jgi:DNA modification methylase